jgi:hypothetical protein
MDDATANALNILLTSVGATEVRFGRSLRAFFRASLPFFPPSASNSNFSTECSVHPNIFSIVISTNYCNIHRWRPKHSSVSCPEVQLNFLPAMYFSLKMRFPFNLGYIQL